MSFSHLYFHGDGHIRLLTLRQGNFEDDVACTLEAVSLNHVSPYEGLSYRWGGSNEHACIEISGEPFRVTLNLFVALRHLRYPDKPRILWVDALCINQRDIAETNSQVWQMSQIYGRATTILAWTGTDDGYGEEAIETLREIETRLVSEERLRGLAKFIQRPYWTRLWIVQEIVLARSVNLVCGTKSVSWNNIRHVFTAKVPSESPFERMPYDVRHDVWRARHLWHARETWSAGSSLSFLQLLNKFNPCRCSEVKDYVFALHGLSRSDIVHESIDIDYGSATTYESVFRSATIACILEDRNLNVLSLLRRWTKWSWDQVSPGWPIHASWVGDWSTVRVTRPLVEPDAMEQMYAAARSVPFNAEDLLQYATQGILKVRGVIVDNITSVMDAVNPYEPTWEDRVRAWEPSGLDHYLYPSGENGVTAFWRTLVFDSCYADFHRVHARLSEEQIQAYQRLFLIWSRRIDDDASSALEPAEGDGTFTECLRWGERFNSVLGWTFCQTSKRYFARAQPDVTIGDAVVILHGSVVPMILRAVESPTSFASVPELREKQAWRLVGPAYVHGILDGEALRSESLDRPSDTCVYLV